MTKQAEAAKWAKQHPGAPLPRIMAAALRGEPLPVEPLEFG